MDKRSDAPGEWAKTFELMKISLRIVTFIIIPALVCADTAWGGVNNALAPDTKRAVEELSGGLTDLAWGLFKEIEKARRGDRDALEGLIAFIGRKYVDGKEGDSEFNHVAAYLIREHNAGAYLAEIDRVITALREVAERVEKEYPMDKCWARKSLRDPETSVYWTKAESRSEIGLHLQFGKGYFDCVNSLYVERWLKEKGIDAEAIGVEYPSRDRISTPDTFPQETFHMINLIKIDDTFSLNNLPSLRIAMGITPFDLIRGIVPFGVINGSRFYSEIVMRGRAAPEHLKKEEISVRENMPFIEVEALTDYQKLDSGESVYGYIRAKTNNRGFSFEVRTASMELSDITDIITDPYRAVVQLPGEHFLDVVYDLRQSGIAGNAHRLLNKWKKRGWIEYDEPKSLLGAELDRNSTSYKGMQLVLEDVLRLIQKIAYVRMFIPKWADRERGKICLEMMGRIINLTGLPDEDKLRLLEIINSFFPPSQSLERLGTILLRAGNCGIDKVIFTKEGQEITDMPDLCRCFTFMERRLRKIDDELIGIDGSVDIDGLRVKIRNRNLIFDIKPAHRDNPEEEIAAKLKKVVEGGIEHIREGKTLKDRVIWTGRSAPKKDVSFNLTDEQSFALISAGEKIFMGMDWMWELKEINDLPLMKIREAVNDMLLDNNAEVIKRHLIHITGRDINPEEEIEYIWIDLFQEGVISGVFRIEVHLKGGEVVKFGLITSKNTGLGNRLTQNDRNNLAEVSRLYDEFNTRNEQNLPQEVPRVYEDGYGECKHDGRNHSIYMFMVEWLDGVYEAGPGLTLDKQLILKGLYRGVPLIFWDKETSSKIREMTVITATTIFELMDGKIVRNSFGAGDIMSVFSGERVYLITIPYFYTDPNPWESLTDIAEIFPKIIGWKQEYQLETAGLDERYLLLILGCLEMADTVNNLDKFWMPTGGETIRKTFPEPELVFSGITKALIRMYGEEKGVRRAISIFEKFAEKDTEYKNAALDYLYKLKERYNIKEDIKTLMERASAGSRYALEELIAFIGRKYVTREEGDSEFNQVAAYLIREHNAGAYLAEIDKVMKALREVAERVEKEYPIGKCWIGESIRDPECGVVWTKGEPDLPAGLELVEQKRFFDCFNSIYVEEWLRERGVNAEVLEITPGVIYEHLDPGIDRISPEHVINFIKIEDPAENKLPPLRIAMGITPFDILYGIVPFSVINHSPFDYKMVMKGKPFPEERRRLIRSMPLLKNLDLLQYYYITDSSRGINASILVKTEREEISIYATVSYVEMSDLVFRPYPRGIGIRFSRRCFSEIAKELKWGEINGNAQEILSRWGERGWIEYFSPMECKITKPHIQAALEKGMQMVLEDVLLIVYKISRARVLLPKETGFAGVRNEIINRMLNQLALFQADRATLIRIFQLPMIDSASQEILATAIFRAGNCGINGVVFRKSGRKIEDITGERECLGFLNHKLKEVKDIGIDGSVDIEGLRIKIIGRDLVIDMDINDSHLRSEDEESLRQYLQTIKPGAYQTVNIEALCKQYNLEGRIVEKILKELGFEPISGASGKWRRTNRGRPADILDTSV